MHRRLILLACLALGTSAAPASAATTLGGVATAEQPTTCSSSDQTVFQVATSEGGNKPYVVPSAGVIVRFRIAFGGTDGTPFKFRVFRPQGSDVKSIAVVRATLDASGNATVPARVAVQPGDLLGIGRSAGAGDLRCAIQTGNMADQIGGDDVDVPDDGTHPAAAAEGGYRINAEAILEPDADGDGFGDESQDRCPSDKSRVDVACETDLALDLSLAEPRIPFSTVGVATFTVQNVSASPADAARVTGTLPTGLGLVAVTPGSGSCAPGAIDCSFGTLPGGATGVAIAVVKGVAAGPQVISGAASSATADTNAGNNGASATLDVLAAPLPPRTCRVPALRGLTKAAATKALKAAGCRIGRTRNTGGPVRRRVRSQSIPARTVVALDTKVDVVQRGQRRKRKRS